MTTLDTVLDRFAAVNRRLRDEGDAARIRYAAVEADPLLDDELMAVVVWELPEPDGEVWPLEVLDRYSAIAKDAISSYVLTVQSLFRAPDEVPDASVLGAAVVQAA